MYDNYHYPYGADNEFAPWNDPVVPEKEFEITCSQSLSHIATIWTDNYTPGACGVDYEPDDEGGCVACGWQDDDDTSDTNWSKEYETSGYYTPLQLIGLFKETLQEQLKSWEGMEDTVAGKKNIRRIEHLIEECEAWTDDETEFIQD